MNNSIKDINSTWGYRILFFGLAFLILGVLNSDFLYGAQDYSYFISNNIYFGETIRQTGGLLIYVSAFLTQFLFYPILGALMLSALLVGVEVAMERLFKAGIISFVAPVLLLFTMTSVGYAMYDRFENSFLFSSVIGVLCALLLLALSRWLCSKSWGVYAALLLSSLSYFAIGSYAIFAAILIVVDGFCHGRKSKHLCFFVGLLFVLVVVYFGSNYLFHEFYSSALYSPLPSPHFALLFYSSLATFAVVIAIQLYGEKLHRITLFQKPLWSYGLLLAMVLGAYFFSYRDANFDAEIKVRRLAEERKWDELISYAEGLDHPTRPVLIYRAIALSTQGKLAEKLFDYTCEFSKSKTRFLSETTLMNEDFCIYASFFNYAYLWSMEFWTTVGSKYAYLRKMALVSLLNDEPELARRYNDALKQTLFQRRWAMWLDKYINDPRSLYVDCPEFNAVQKETPKVDFILKLNRVIDSYRNYNFLSYENAERRLLADMFKKDLRAFSSDFRGMRDYYAKTGIPRCVQEAVLTCAYNGNPKIVKGLNIDMALVEKIDDFYKAIKSYGNPEVAKEKLKARHGHTYYYFYYFSSFK